MGALFAHRPARGQLPHAHHGVRRDFACAECAWHQSLHLGTRLRCWFDLDGCDWKLSALGADCHCALPDGFDLVCPCLQGTSALGGCRSQLHRSDDASGGITSSLVFLVIAIVGTTIAPWQLFFQQSCVAEKRLRFADLKWARLNTLIGATFTVCVAGAMMLVGNYGFEHKVAFKDPAQLALALGPIAGNFVRNGVLLLMVNAAVLGTTAISLASAWVYGEVKGWEHSLHKKLWEAPGFYATYIVCVGAAAAIVLIPHVPLQLVIISVQVFAGLILPPPSFFFNCCSMTGSCSATVGSTGHGTTTSTGRSSSSSLSCRCCLRRR
jgi:hypothetical protein